MSQNMKVSLLLSVAQTGLNHLQDVIKELEGAGIATEEFKREAAALGDALADLERDSGLIDAFAGLKRETADLSRQLGDASQHVDALAQELERAAKSSSQAAQAQAESAQKLDAARAWQAKLKEAIAATREEMQALKKSSQNAVDAGLNDRIEQAGQRLKTLQQEAKEAADNTQLLASAHRQSEAAAKNAARSEEALAQQYSKAVAEAGQLSAKLSSKNKALSQTREQMQAAGLQTSQLTQQQKALAERMQQVSQNGDGLVARMRNVAEAAKQQSVSIEKAGKAWSTFSKGIGLGLGFVGVQSFTGAMGQLRDSITEVLRVGAGFETMRAQLSTLYGSVEQGQQAFEWIRDFGKTVPYELEAVTDAFTKLKAMGLDPMDGTMQAIADQAAALGGGAQTLEGVVLALGQAWTKQKLQGEEALQLIERGVPVWDLLSRATGKTAVQLQEMASAGKLGRDAIAALIEEMGRANAGASASAMNTWSGQIALLKTNWQDFLDTIASSGLLDLFRQEIAAINQAIAEMAQTGELKQWAQAASNAIVSLYEAMKTGAGFVAQYGNAIQSLVNVIIGFKALSLGKSVIEWGADIAVGAKNIEQSASVIASAGKVAAAGWMGWNIGSWLREEFLVIEQAGIYLAQTLTKMAARAQAAWEMLKAPFTDDTISAAQERLAQTLENIEREYGELLVAAEQARDVQKEVAKSSQDAAAAIDASAQAVKGAAEAAGEVGEAMTGALATIDEVAEAMQRAGTSAETTASALKTAFESAVPKAKTLADITALEGKLRDLESAGRIGAQGVQAISEVLEQQRKSIDQAAAASTAMAEAFKTLGVDAAAALGGISEEAKAAIDAVDQITEGVKQAGVNAEQAAQALEMAFTAAIPKADSLEALDALQRKLTATGDAGKIGAEGIKRVQAELDKQRRAIEEQIPGIQSLEEAYRKLGVRSKAELQKAADEAIESFNALKESGIATQRELNDGWVVMAQRIIDAADGIAPPWLEAQAAQHGFVISTDELGKSVIKTAGEMDKLVRSAERLGTVGKQGTQELKQGLEEVDKQADDTSAGIVKYATAITGTFLSARAQMSKWAAEAAAHSHALEGQMQSMKGRISGGIEQYRQLFAAHRMLLTKYADEYVEAMERIDASIARVNRSITGTAAGIDALQQRLLELNGTDEQIAEDKQRREREEIQRQIELMKLEMERAQVRRDPAAYAQAQEDLKNLQRQLELLRQIHSEEDKQRRKKAREDKEREREDKPSRNTGSGGGSDTGGSNSRGGNAPTQAPPVNITLHANGINDPQKLARLIEPELKRLAHLAR